MPKVQAHGAGEVRAVTKPGGQLVKQKDIRVAETFDFELGNAGAHTAATRGFKKWASDRDHGLTVEATVTVTLTCNQDEQTHALATEKAGHMAEHYARQGLLEMQEYFDQ